MIVNVFAVYTTHDAFKGAFSSRQKAQDFAHEKFRNFRIQERKAVLYAGEYYLVEAEIDLDLTKKTREEESLSSARMKLTADELNAIRKWILES